jgi:hypothetical protein
VTNLFALVLAAAERLKTEFLTGELGSFTDVTRRTLGFLAAVAKDVHIDVTWRTCSWVTNNLAGLVLAILVLLQIAMLAAAMR